MNFSLEMPEFKPGTVWLVGAGPGDPGLLTLYAWYALEHADAVVYDALIGEEIRKLIRGDTLQIHAGKRGGRPSPQQRDISQKLIELAQSGHRVLRLKGGDPFVFARGGEEALALVDAGVSFRIVPGISAGIGGLAYAGIPATHRDIGSVVTFVTGHSGKGQVPENLDWRALAHGSPTLVFYMAMRHIKEITDGLLAAGRPRNEPVALVGRASTPDQQVVMTTLADAAMDSAAVTPPAIVVIGDIVRLRGKLDWLSQLPQTQRLAAGKSQAK